MKVLVEGIGSMAFGPLLKYYKELDWELIGIDVTGSSFGFYKNVKPYIVPKYLCNNCFSEIEKVIIKENIDLVFPTVNEGLLDWSKIKEYFFKNYNCRVMISSEYAIASCIDKWKTYKFFIDNDIPTPSTSIDMSFEVLKPRVGRGSDGIYFKRNVDKSFCMDGYISQELVAGDEYTIDILCDFESNPIYIIPRKRIATESGVSIKGVTVFDEEIIHYSKKIIQVLKPIGMINIQCFKNNEGIKFIEINPRMAGGSSLSFASSDNWLKVIDGLLKGRKPEIMPIKYNNYMFRFYNDVIVQESDLIR